MAAGRDRSAHMSAVATWWWWSNGIVIVAWLQMEPRRELRPVCTMSWSLDRWSRSCSSPTDQAIRLRPLTISTTRWQRQVLLTCEVKALVRPTQRSACNYPVSVHVLLDSICATAHHVCVPTPPRLNFLTCFYTNPVNISLAPSPVGTPMCDTIVTKYLFSNFIWIETNEISDEILTQTFFEISMPIEKIPWNVPSLY
jgi:hypothetical protein